MARRKSIRWSLKGAGKTARSHREDMQPPGLQEAKNLYSQLSDACLVLRPGISDRSPSVESLYGGDYDEFPTLTFTNTSGDRLVATNRAILAYASGSSSYEDMTSPLATVTASNSAGASSITLSSASSSAPSWVGRLVRYSGETEYYEITAATTTTLTVDRVISGAHSSATLCVESHWRGGATSWPVKRCSIGEIDLLMPEQITGQLGADDLNVPLEVKPSVTFTSFTGAPEDQPEDYGYIGSRAPSNVSATAQAGGSLGAGTYYYKVAAKDSLGRGDLSAEVSATADATNATVLVDWDGLNGVSDYYVWRGTSPGNLTEYVEVTGATQLTDDGTLVWTTASPSSLEYRSGLTVTGLYGSQYDDTLIAFAENAGGTKYVFRRTISTDDDFHHVDFSGETVLAADFFRSGSVGHKICAVMTDTDIYVSTDSGATFAATSSAVTPASGDLLAVMPGYVLFCDVSDAKFYVYTVSESAWDTGTSYDAVANATMAVGESTGQFFALIGEGFVHRLIVGGSFAGQQDVVLEDSAFPEPSYAFAARNVSESVLMVWGTDGKLRQLQNIGKLYTQDLSVLSRTWESQEPKPAAFESPCQDRNASPWLMDARTVWVNASDGALKYVSWEGGQEACPKPTAAGSDTVVLVGFADPVGLSYRQYPDEDVLVMWGVRDTNGTYVLGAPKITTFYASAGSTSGAVLRKECACFTVAGGYFIIGGVPENGVLRGRRIMWPAPGTVDDWAGAGSGFADLDGDGRIVSLATVGNNVVVFEEGRIGVLLATGDIDAPFAYRPIAEGLYTISNPVTVVDRCFFVGNDGLLYQSNGVSTSPVQTGFDLTLFTDFNPTTPVWMAYSDDLHSLCILVQGTTTLHVVNPTTGAWTEWDLPTVDDGGTTLYPMSVFQGRTVSETELVIGYKTKTAGSNLVMGAVDIGGTPRGKDTVGGSTAHWCGMIETPAVDVSGGGERVTVRAVTVESYTDSDPSKVHAGVTVASDDNDNWRCAGSDATVTLTTTAATGVPGTAAWSAKIADGDDITKVFTLPAQASKCRVFLKEGGSYTQQTAGTDYTITDTKEITFATAPTSSQEVYAWWDSVPYVLVNAEDLVLDGNDDMHLISSVDSATELTLDWYPAASTTGQHIPARELPHGDGEVDLGVGALCRRIQVRVYLYPEDDAGTSDTAALKALRLYLTGGGREEEDVV